MDMFIFLTATLHVIYTPFTKVEESFNLQAMHDILYLRHNFSQYDHHDFPGVVPRTFLGPLFISVLSTPFILLFETLRINKFWAQYVVRLMLAAVISNAWINLRRVLFKLFNPDLALWWNLITLTQFHFMFYMSRTLPNIMVLPFVLYALTYWFKGQIKPFIICCGIAILVFRAELIIFFGLLLAFDLLQKRTTMDTVLKIALPAGLAILATTIIVDSFFWQRLVWPEGEVLWYNTILNKSSNWGTSPFLWYFYSALPRAMGASLLLVPIGFYYERRIRPLILAAVGFVFIYSLLPHKELRFVIYVVPVLNIATACACNRLWINAAKSRVQSFMSLCGAGHLLINVFVTLFLVVVAGTNYPGGAALARLHRLEANNSDVSVHISNLAAQTGVSRFMQYRDDWRYCKNESITYLPEETLQYTHLLVEAKNKQNSQLWTSLLEEYEPLEYVDCFSSIGIQYDSLLPVRIKTKPCIVILKRRPKSAETVKGKQKTASNVKPEERIVKSKEKKPKREVTKESFKSKEETVAQEEEQPQQQEAFVKESLLPEKQVTKESFKSKEETVAQEEEQPRQQEAFVKESLLPEESAAEKIVNEPVIQPPAEEDVFYADEDYDEVKDQFQDLHSVAEPTDDNASQTKEINFQELHNLALGQVTKKTRATRLKLRKIIEQHYRSKGKQIEDDSAEKYNDKPEKRPVKQTVKAIIKQERIREMIEQIATMDLTSVCNLEKVSTKECLKLVIDKIDEDNNTT